MRVVVLIGGQGTNLQHLIDHCRQVPEGIELCAVISHRPEVKGLTRATAANIPTACVDHTAYATRTDFEQALYAAITPFQADLIVLAGFMRILSADFVNHYAGRMVNIHPSRLPHFPGLNTHLKVLAAGHATHGATVHFVTGALDGGPIIAQTACPVLAADTPDTLKVRVQATEAVLYPTVIQWLAEQRLCLKQGTVFLDDQPLPTTGKQLTC